MDTQHPVVAAPAAAEIAGFWQRIFAALADTILLGIAGWAIGHQFYVQMVALGQYGRAIGFAVSLAYFGVLNSGLGGGATIGKRIFGLRVIRRDGEYAGLARTLVRSVIYLLPFYLNGFDLSFLPLDATNRILVFTADAVIVFGGMGAIVYLYIANRTTRQSLHDLAAGTYVVRAPTAHAAVTGRIRGIHLAAVTVWLLIFLTGVPLAFRYGNLSVFGNAIGVDFAQLQKIQKNVNADSNISSTSVQLNRAYFNGATSTSLIVVVNLHGMTNAPEVIADGVAGRVLTTRPDIFGKGQLAVVVRYGYELGIANSWQTFRYAHTPAEWRQRLRSKHNDIGV